MSDSGEGNTRAHSQLWPRAAASAAIFRGRQVLLAERGHGPRKGVWSLPGGKIEAGETSAQAAVREIREETGLEVELAGLLDVHNAIVRDQAGKLEAHFLIAVYYGTSRHGEPIAATEISDARFVPLERVADYQLTDGAAHLITVASKRLNLG